MKTTVFSLFFAIACLTIACNNNSANQQTEEQQAWDAVMAVHDEVMPKMSDINRMSDDLRARANALDSTQMATKQNLMDAAQALERADEGMMSWMAEVKSPETMRSEQKTHEEIMNYLDEQKNKVNQVRDSINNSLEQGKMLLEQTPAPAADSTSM